MTRWTAFAALLIGLTSGCATIGEPPPTSLAAPPAGRTLVVGVGLDPQNRPIVQALARALATELDDRWGSVFEATTFSRHADQYGARLPLGHLEHVAAGAPLDSGVADGLRQIHRVHTLVFLDVRVFDQDWGQETKRTRIKLVAWALDLTRLAVAWRATSAPEVEGEGGRGFQVAAEIAVRELVRSVAGEPPTISDKR